MNVKSQLKSHQNSGRSASTTATSTSSTIAQASVAGRLSDLHQSATPFMKPAIERDGEAYFCIEHSGRLPEFFMSLTSASNHWMFVSSYGAITCGRKDPNGAFFPYYSSDKLSDLRHVTGPTTLIRTVGGNGSQVWEPWSRMAAGNHPFIHQNLFKNATNSKLIFEEINSELGLVLEYRWSFSHRFGFVRACRLKNIGDQPIKLELLDGFQNILPPGLDNQFQLRFSNLADAYKRSERLEETGLGLFYLNSIPTDRAEPSEGLRANVVWQSGLTSPTILLSSRQLVAFRAGQRLVSENDLRGQRGAFFVNKIVELAVGESKSWELIANVDLDQTDVNNLQQQLLGFNRHAVDSSANAMIAEIRTQVHDDIALNQVELERLISAADGKQVSGDSLQTSRHQSNVLFNIMRGGVPANGYELNKADFLRHVRNFDEEVFERAESVLNGLPESFSLKELETLLDSQSDLDLVRLGNEYLPLTFSRRHGDPTRPWNSFSITTTRADGSRNLDYQGNWRDIFQNWEALSLSFPRFTECMVFRFLNASTLDGYNPYRLTKNGFEWETPDPTDPWSNIGYWGDHQIIYLLKLMEWSHQFSPKRMDRWLNVPVCVYAQVPYRVRTYQKILDNPQTTIDFDFELAEEITSRVQRIGADGKLLRDANGEICHVTLAEKLLVPLLAKLTNFVPGGGIWLNTQRPEWNDANNALVGNGLSMVTVCYLRRYLAFLVEWFNEIPLDSFSMSSQVHDLVTTVGDVLSRHQSVFTADEIADTDRKNIVDQLSQIGSDFRTHYYQSGLATKQTKMPVVDCIAFLKQCLQVMDQTIRINRRSDGLFHAYNLLDWNGAPAEAANGFQVHHLYKMLEGQVAVLSSGLLTAAETVRTLDALRASTLYRADQDSYLLYPDRELPRFLEKNNIPSEQVTKSALLLKLAESVDQSLIRRDTQGEYHFDGSLRNVADLKQQLALLNQHAELTELINTEHDLVLQIYESVFEHRQFTGRSGTFFAYEGLGSIYWHMVSKLALAITESIVAAQDDGADKVLIARLIEHYRHTRDGIGLKKSPSVYGAFPTDPYSHTPAHAGAQQPGMTGQVKEDILSRFAELGVRIRAGQLSFDALMLESDEWTQHETTLEFTNQDDRQIAVSLPAGSCGFTLCQTPIIYRLADHSFVRVFDDTSVIERVGSELTHEETARLFDRDGSISKIEVGFALGDQAAFKQQLAAQSHLHHQS